MADPTDEDRSRDAAAFIGLVTQLKWQPKVWKAVGEIGFEWIAAGKHAFVSIIGDGRFAYTMLVDGKFRPGDEDGPLVTTLPHDLRLYLDAG